MTHNSNGFLLQTDNLKHFQTKTIFGHLHKKGNRQLKRFGYFKLHIHFLIPLAKYI